MDLEELRKLYQRALQVQDAATRDALSGAAARLAATQSVVQGALSATQPDPRGEVTRKALVDRVRKEIVDSARALAEALDDPSDAKAAGAVAAEAIAAEAIAAEALAAEPMAAEPFAAEPMAAEPLAAEPLAAEPLAAEPLAAEPMAAEPFAAEPLAAEPFAAEPMAAEPMAAEPFAAAGVSPLTAALNAFMASTGPGTESGDD